MDQLAVLPFHTYLWKIASRCNLNCTYCYVYNLADQRWRTQPSFMSERVARAAAGRIVEHCGRHEKVDVAVVYHGGEPLLGGVELLRRVNTALAETLLPAGIKPSVGMQSNGLLFTSDVGDFMLEWGTTIGVSLDGPPAVNDVHRVDHQGEPVSAQLEEALRLLSSERYRRVFTGFLTVIDPAADPVEVTRYLLSWDPPSIDFLFPLNNHDRRPRGKEHDIAKPVYGDWLIRSFDYWLEQPTRTRIRVFNSIIGQLCGLPSLVESIGLDPVDLVVVETNGDIEAVDSLKSAYDGATHLGFNVFDHDFDAVASHVGVRSRQFGAASLCATCRACPVVDVCGGGYLPHRYSRERQFDNPSVYSADLEKLIRHIHARLRAEVAPTASVLAR